MEAPSPGVVQTTVPCPKCQKTIPAGKKFCNRCGASLATPVGEKAPDPTSLKDEERSFPIPPVKMVSEETPVPPPCSWTKPEEIKETPPEKKEEKTTTPSPLCAVEPGARLPESGLPPVHSLPEQGSGSNTPWWILIIVLAVLIGAGVAGYMKFRKPTAPATPGGEVAKTEQQQTTVAHPTVAPATAQAPKPSPSEATPASTPVAQPQPQAGTKSVHQMPFPIPAAPTKPVVLSTTHAPQMTSTPPPTPQTAPVPEQEHVKLVPLQPQPQPSPVHPQVPSKPAPAVSAVPSSGFIVWKGAVEKGGVIEFNGNVASPGSIQTGLPGVPVQIDLYTKNFALVEFPSASNNYRRMRIRSKNKVDSIIIKWQRAQ